MKNASPFQLIILAVFIVLSVAGVLAFALFDPGGSGEDGSVGSVEVWGTMSTRAFRDVTNEARFINDALVKGIVYVEKDPRTFEAQLVEALATNTGPDLFFLTQDQIVQQGNKVFVVPFETFSERRFKDSFVEEGELYLIPTGILAFPFLVDPMVMYWNRSILSREGIATPPQYWDEFFTLSPRMTKRDQSSNILQATVALGEYANVLHAKEVLATLMFQAGNPIVRLTTDGLRYEEVLQDNFGFATNPAEAALRYYTEFSNPVKSVYSWNRALPEARQAFVAEELAFYFGFASEFESLRQANPNLNFDMALLPQAREDGRRATFGNMIGLAIARNTDNINGALQVATFLSGDQMQTILPPFTGLPPIARRVLANPPSDARSPILYTSAIIARGWHDPNPELTDIIFKEMIGSVTSGRLQVKSAVNNAASEISRLLR